MSDTSPKDAVKAVAKKCKHGETGCGQYYDCGRCTREMNAAAYRRLTPAQKAYDNFVDPKYAYHEDFPSGCSCHLSAPCSYCMRDTEE
jgi:hypothetical protein